MAVTAGRSIATETITAPNGNIILTANTALETSSTVSLNTAGSSTNAVTANCIVVIGEGTSNGTNISAITTGGSLVAPGGILMVASGNVVFNAPVSTAAASGTAGNLTVISGANFTQSNNLITILGTNTSDSFVSFANTGGLVTTATSATSGSANGGNLNAIAFGGAVTFLNQPTTTGGFGSGTNGNIIIVGSGSGINLGSSTNTSGGTGGGGNITVQAQTPSSSFVVSTTTFDISSGSPLNGTPSTANISMQGGTSITANNAAISMTSGGAISLQTITDNSLIGNGGSVILNAQSISLGQGAITVNAASGGNGTGGTISLTGSSFSFPSPLTLTANGAGSGQGGAIIVDLTSNNALQIGAGSLVMSANGGGTGAGGSVTVSTLGTLTANGATGVTVTPGINGHGGTISRY